MTNPQYSDIIARLEKHETVLPDDYPVYGGYLYVVDGKVTESNWHDVDVAYLKKRTGAQEVRRCDIHGRHLLRALQAGEAHG